MLMFSTYAMHMLLISTKQSTAEAEVLLVNQGIGQIESLTSWSSSMKI